MKPIKLKVKTSNGSYPILIGANLVSKFSNLLSQNSIKFEKCLLIIDKNVPKKKIIQIKKGLKNKEVFTQFIKANEKNKNQKSLDLIVKILLKKNFSREDCLVSVGGGITGDVSGFAASIYKRGLKFINIPTTLLSQVDSSIGGKTGINTSHGKNLIGNFYQPKLVLSDSDFLKSLPKREIICGYGEILKHSLISNRKFYEFLNKKFSKILRLKSPFIEKAIYESCKIKKKIVEQDEKERDLRKVLNFGHTFAHAYEASLGYSKKLNHGEAVLLGIYTAINFSLNSNFLNRKDYNLIVKHIINSKLPFKIKNFFKQKDLKKILFYMMKDKKNNSNQINLILLKKIGKPLIGHKFRLNKIRSFLKKELN